MVQSGSGRTAADVVVLPAPVWNLRLLGPIGVECDGRALGLGQPKQVAVLALLALRAGECVAADEIVEALWDGRPPRTAGHSVQIYVSGLRKVLGAAAGAPTIETRPPGYRLLVEPGVTDLERAERGLADGRALLAAGDALGAAVAMRAALGQWSGRPLADVAYAEFAQVHVRRLDELRRATTEALVAAELAAGHTAEALAGAEALVAEDGLRQRSVELYMTALYRSGRHVSALRTYEQHRAALVEIGATPAPSLSRLNEQILLHDPALLGRADAGSEVALGAPTRNPYKGLRPFTEDDAADFFGRDALVEQMLERLRGGARLLAVVGPSGGGKSSAVAAGLLPQLRRGAVPGSDRWQLATIVPGAHPVAETDAALARAGDPGRPGAHTLLVVDQFEELFMATEPSERDAYLGALTEAISDAGGDLTVVVTLRADHYDRPMLHPRFAEPFTRAVLNVLPMTAAELHAAVVGPATGAGLDVDTDLVAEVIADTVSQPGSLPLLQYALADQVERTRGAALRLVDYRALGGVRGALTRRADEVYDGLARDLQPIATQVLLRMVRVSAEGTEGCRQLPVAELTGLGIDPIGLSELLEQFVRHRLLAVGTDPVTGGPTVGVAHEALVAEWPRLAGWVARHRTALRRHAALRAATIEWEAAGRHDDYLVRGTRLDDARAVVGDGTLLVTSTERTFVDASVAHLHEATAADAERRLAQNRLRRQARRRLLALVATGGLLAAALTVAVLQLGTAGRPRHAVLYVPVNSEIDHLVAAGFDAAVSSAGFTSAKVDGTMVTPAGFAEHFADGDLVVEFDVNPEFDELIRSHPRTRFVIVDREVSAPNVTELRFADNEGSFLAGAAAALTSATGTVGFIGGVDIDQIWSFQAGFEAGARQADPDVRVLTAYLTEPPDWDGFFEPALGERAARAMYEQGADVIFAAAGSSGLGVFETAAELSTDDRQLWAIGVDSDQFETVDLLPGTFDAAAWKPHILTSMVKRFDRGIPVAVDAAVSDHPPRVVHLGLADGGVELSYSGGYIDDLRTRIEALRADIVAGRITVPLA